MSRARGDAGGPLPHVRNLFARHAPGVSLARLADRADMPVEILERVFKTEPRFKMVPKSDVIAQIAQALSCTSNEVLFAFTLDLHPVNEGHTEGIEELVSIAATLSRDKLEALIQVARESANPT